MSASATDRKKPATYADLEAVPEHLVAEIIDGRLVTHPRPRARHGAAAFALGNQLGGPFQNGVGGPGGWIFIVEPELHLGPDVVVPDLAGWRRERMSTEPETAWIGIVPDWVCEILSTSTERYDKREKRQIYAEHGVPHYWMLDPRVLLLETQDLVDGRWQVAGVYQESDTVAAQPFEAAPFPLGRLWPFDTPPADPSSKQGG